MPKPHLDLVDRKTEQARGVLGDERGHDALESLDQLHGSTVQRRQHLRNKRNRVKGALQLLMNRYG